jgi:TatD DNase family protein
MFDSHCHLHDSRVDEVAAQIARAKACGVRHMLLAGVDPDGWRMEDELARAHPELVVSYGVHPQAVASLTEAQATEAVAFLERELIAPTMTAPVAIGEIGLDGLDQHRASLALQERIFLAQIALAKMHALPVVLHVLRMHGRALELLEAAAPLPRAGVLHSSSAPAELVPRYLALGLSLSFAGAVTSPSARRVRAALLAVPRERLLVETDAPDQTPFSRRPQRNEPAFLVEIIAAIAQIRGESPSEVARYTFDNACRLFGVIS